MKPVIRLAAVIVATLTLSACETGSGGTPSAPPPATEVPANGLAPLTGQVFGTGKAATIVLLHGDVSRGGPAKYMHPFARQVSEQYPQAMVVSLLRPGYSDGTLTSPGNNFNRRDQYTAENNRLVAETLSNLKSANASGRLIVPGSFGRRSADRRYHRPEPWPHRRRSVGVMPLRRIPVALYEEPARVPAQPVAFRLHQLGKSFYEGHRDYRRGRRQHAPGSGAGLRRLAEGSQCRCDLCRRVRSRPRFQPAEERCFGSNRRVSVAITLYRLSKNPFAPTSHGRFHAAVGTTFPEPYFAI